MIHNQTSASGRVPEESHPTPHRQRPTVHWYSWFCVLQRPIFIFFFRILPEIFRQHKYPALYLPAPERFLWLLSCLRVRWCPMWHFLPGFSDGVHLALHTLQVQITGPLQSKCSFHRMLYQTVLKINGNGYISCISIDYIIAQTEIIKINLLTHVNFVFFWLHQPVKKLVTTTGCYYWKKDEDNTKLYEDYGSACLTIHHVNKLLLVWFHTLTVEKRVETSWWFVLPKAVTFSTSRKTKLSTYFIKIFSNVDEKLQSFYKNTLGFQ